MEDCSLFVSLGQLDGRTKGEDGTYSPYPFATRVLSAHLAIFEIGDDQDSLKQYGKPLDKAGPAKMAELSVRVKL